MTEERGQAGTSVLLLPNCVLQIEDPNGKIVFEKKQQAAGTFTLLSAIEGEYKICFTAKGGCPGAV
jgi:hypothetical protein